MNAELAALLREAGATVSADWRDLIVVQNYVPIPMTHDPRGGAWEGRNGFNLVVLAKGTPTWYCKCRTAGDKVLERETAIRARLAGTRELGLSVPPARIAASERIAVQVSPFIKAQSLGRTIPNLSTEKFAALLTATATGAAALATIALREAADLLTAPAQLNLAAAAPPFIAHRPSPIAQSSIAHRPSLIAQSPIAQSSIAHRPSLIAALDQTIPPRPQHGDLWWRNLLHARGQLCALDFERYGTIWVPLFDDLHLVFTSLALRTPGAIGALAQLRSDTADARACRALIQQRAAHESLTPQQQDGVLVYYLAKMAADLRANAVDDRFAKPYVADLALAEQLLASGTTNLLSA